MGHSDESARKICGKIQAETEGASSSQEFGSAPMPQMSQAEMMKEEKPEGGDVTLTMQQAEALANAVFNDDLETAKRILSEVMNIQEESPQAPPAQ